MPRGQKPLPSDARRPDLEFILNGGLASLTEATRALDGVDGVMLGRAAYQTPWELAAVDTRLYGEPRARAWRQILAQGAIKPDADWRVVQQALAAVA